MKTNLHTSAIYLFLVSLFCTFYAIGSLRAQTCPGLGNLTLTVVAGPTPTLNAPAQLCAGVNGTIAVNQTFSSYAWSTGDNSQSIQVSAPGPYSVTVSNAAGCTGTATVNVAPSPVPSPNIVQNNYTCNGIITLNAGSGFSSYSWSNGGGSSQNAAYNTPGLYTVTVSNAQGCTGTSNFNVTIPTPPIVSISGNLNICTGDNTTLSASGGFNSYSWSGGGNSANLSVSTGGLYTVTVTDALGCTDTESATVVSILSPTPTVSSGSLCPGASLTLNVTNAPFSGYTWTTGSTGGSTSVSAPGDYTVTVTAANGCTGSATSNVAALPSPNPVITQATYACNGQLSLNAGAGFSTYAWSNGSSIQSISVNTSGLYTVTVTNAQGCTGTDDLLATIPAPPVVSITGNNSFCGGTSASLTATAGFNSYSWNNGQSGANINVTNGGIFTVTVTDGFGCTATNTFTVNQLPAPQPTVAGPLSVCSGLSATWSTTAPFPTYSWSNGQSTASILVNTAGNYTVTVTAANGCTGTDSQTFSLIPAPSPLITEANYLCNGQLALNAGAGFSTYSWSNSAVTAGITVTTSGNYLVTVTNAQGCTGTDAYFASIPPEPLVNITGSPSICPGSSTNLAATAGFDAYVWSTTATSAGITVSAAGNYEVTVTDAFGCTTTSSFSVAQLAVPTVNISGPSQICPTGSATFSVPGTFSAYSWSTGTTTPTITVNTAANYTVTVTATNGCTATDSQTLVVANSLQPQITELPYACNGQVTLDAGTGFNTYTWDGGQNTQTISVNANGSYSVTVSDAGGCTGTTVVTTAIPPAPTVAISGNNNICSGSSTTLNATAGWSAYSWSNGQVGASISVQMAGPYSVTATDAFGCTVAGSFQLMTTPLPQPQITGPAAICAGNSATLNVGQTFATYTWSDGSTGANILVNTTGLYAVTVTDVNGCTGTDDITLVVNANPTAAITEAAYACDAQITLDAPAGFTAYAWSGPNAFSAVGQQAVGNSSGPYTLTITDANGCSATAMQDVAVPTLNQVSLSGSTQFCLGGSTDLAASPGFVTYSWSSGSNLPNITATAVGSYTITATDALGCPSTASLTVSNFLQPAPVIAGPQSVCPGSNATLSVGGSFSSYTWSSGETTTSIIGQPPFSAAVTVTDANGCTGTAQASVVVSNQLSPNIVQLPYACDGQITLDAGAGFPNYSWNNAALTSTIQVTQSGVYTVTVSDNNGCSGTASIQVNVPVVPVLSITGGNVLCPGQFTTLTATAGFIAYQWSGGQNSATISTDQTGSYQVTATDSQGCSATASLTVAAAPPLAPVLQGLTTVCPGGSSVFSVAGNFASYSWSNGATTASITVSQAGNYVVTVTSSAGCSSSAAIDLNTVALVPPQLSTAPSLCPGAVVPSGITNQQNYTQFLWNTGATTASISVQGGQTYSVTVTDAQACTQTAGFTVLLSPAANPSLIQLPYTCDGQITLDAGAGFVDYNWTGPAGFSVNGQLASVTTPGIYTVVVTNSQGCTGSAGGSVAIPVNQTVNISGNTSFCAGGSTTLTATPGFAAYAWSTGSTAQVLNVSSAGLYSITITNAGGCTATAAVTVQANGLTPALQSNEVFCQGNSLTITVVGTYAGYAWSDGSSQPLLTVTQAGLYTVTVTDATGCTGTASSQILAVPPASVTINDGGNICGGNTVSLSTTGSVGTFEWSNGATGTPLQVDQAGTYTVTVTDPNGCTATNAVTVLAGTPVTTELQKESCRLAEAGTQVFTYAAASSCDSVVTIMTTYQPTKPGLALDLTPVVQAKPGQEIVLEIAGNFPIDSVAFSTQLALSCANCLNPALIATTPGVVQVTAFDGDGCQASAEIRILIDRKLAIYVPNILQPGSVQNGYFTVFSGPEISAVRNFSVFDRWGNALFSRADLPTNDPTMGWDGKFRDQVMLPGVYVYYFEVLLADGSKEVYRGDLTIMQ